MVAESEFSISRSKSFLIHGDHIRTHQAHNNNNNKTLINTSILDHTTIKHMLMIIIIIKC